MNIFIDTEDMEERYAEELYKEYLENKNKELQQIIDKAIEYCEHKYIDCSVIDRVKLLQILKGEDNDN